MVSDENYISQTRVTIWTMRKSTREDIFLEITVLCTSELRIEMRNRLKELELIWVNLKILFYEINTEIFKNAKSISRIPVTSFYRLIISEIFKEENKCLFLDGDLLIDTDLRNIFFQDIGDAYIAGVRDGMFLYAPDNAVRHFNEYGFQNPKYYVNAGVMIFHLAKLRKDGLQNKFLKAMETPYSYMDQDILNKVCEGKIKLLDLKYNYFSCCKNTKICLSGKEAEEKEKSWKIFHFVGVDKPWDNIRVRGGEQWWICAKQALEKDVYEQMYKRAKELAIQSDWSYILERCRDQKIIIIIGYSNIGVDVFISLRRCGVISEIFWCDNSEAKQNLSDMNIAIFPVKELSDKYPNALWINTSQRCCEEINAQLKSLKVKEEQIVIYKKKDEAYYEVLDDRYIDYELRQIRLKALGEL